MGCKANQFESSIIEENLTQAGFEKTTSIDEADYYILNSCTVTHKSDNEALYHLRAAKHKNPDIKTVITGCLAQIEKEDLLKNDFVDIVVGNDEKLDFITSKEEYLASYKSSGVLLDAVDSLESDRTKEILVIQNKNMAYYIQTGLESVLTEDSLQPVFVGTQGGVSGMAGKPTRHEGWYGRTYSWLATSTESPLVNPDTGKIDIAHYKTTLGI